MLVVEPTARRSAIYEGRRDGLDRAADATGGVTGRGCRRPREQDARRRGVPPGARRTEVTLTALQQGPWEVPGGAHVVTRNRAWLVPAAPDVVLSFLTAHPPQGYVARGRGSVSGPEEAVQFVTDERSPLPANTAEAGLEIGVVGRGDGSLVNVVAGAQWTPVRPAAEFVDARDHTVVIRVLYPYRPGTPTIRRAAVSGRRADAIVRVFDALRVAPWVSRCTAPRSPGGACRTRSDSPGRRARRPTSWPAAACVAASP